MQRRKGRGSVSLCQIAALAPSLEAHYPPTMPKGPQGQKRPADVIGAAVMVGRIATGEAEDNPTPVDTSHHSRGGKKGGAARAAALTPEQRSEIAKRAAAKRWGR